MPTVSSSSSIRSEVRFFSQPSILGTVAILSAMVMCGKSPICCMTYPIRRRRLSGLTFVTSSPCKKILPEVGSMMRLIIFIVVVLPHPDGPTKTTISPSGISSERLSTAGCVWPGKTFVKSSSRIIISGAFAEPSFPKPLSVMQTPRSSKFPEHRKEPVEEQCQYDDGEHRPEHQVEGHRAADTRDPLEDVLSQPGTVHVGGDRGDPDDYERRYPYAGYYHRPRERQLYPEQPAPAAHPHAQRALRYRRIHAAQAHDRVAHYR